jgi:hypothetical protein
MSSLEIRPVTSARERAVFIQMPWKLYADDPCWVPPLLADQHEYLDPDRGPFFKHGHAQLWLALRDGEPVGRISAQVNPRYDSLFGADKGFFGFFECEDNAETAGLLFATVEDYLRAQGKRTVEGPFSFTVYDELGILVDGFDSMPSVMLSHNPSYYASLIERCGYTKAIDWFAFLGRRGQTDVALSERLLKLSDQIVKHRGLQLRHFDKRRYEQDANQVKSMFDVAWGENWGHVPMSSDEFKRVAKGMKHMIVPELSYIAEVDHRPVGFAISIYDVNPIIRRIQGKLFPLGWWQLKTGIKKMKRFRMLLMGVLQEYRGLGFEVAMYVTTIREAMRMHFEEAEMSVIVESNEAMIRSIEYLKTDRYKTYRIFCKELI